MEGSKRAERTFTVTQVDPETGEVDRNAVMAALGDIEAVGHRLGGAWIATPVRQPFPVMWDAQGNTVREEHKTIAWVFEFVKYVPAIAPPTATQTDAGDAAATLEADRQAGEAADAAREMLEASAEDEGHEVVLEPAGAAPQG